MSLDGVTGRTGSWTKAAYRLHVAAPALVISDLVGVGKTTVDRLLAGTFASPAAGEHPTTP